MANVTHKVVKGDTLSELAVKYNTTVSALVKLNNIKNPDLIYIGETLIISGTAKTPTKNTTSYPTVDRFGLQANTDRTVFATWEWSQHSKTDHYEIEWLYATGDGVGFIGNKSDTNDRQSTYTAPSNATKVIFRVRPVSKKRKVNGVEKPYFTNAKWSTKKTYNFSDNPPSTPSAPNVDIEGLKMTVSITGLDTNVKYIEFYIVKNDTSKYSSKKVAVTTQQASWTLTIAAGGEYKARCRAYNKKGDVSDWSPYSGNEGTLPSNSKGILTLKALSETSVYVGWYSVTNAKSYDVEYTTKKDYFDSSGEVKKTSVDSVVTHAEITGLESGHEYFFRVRAVNDEGESAWTGIKSVIVGKDPAAPTTWSSTTTAITGDDVILYWVHNSEDGSSQTYAEIEVYIGGIRHTYTKQNTTDEDEKDKTSFYYLDTSAYVEGTKILWRVRTAGITKVYGDWSVQRTIDVYAPPTLEMQVTNYNGNEFETLTQFPINITALAGPNTQTPIGYSLVVTANESYETVDDVGNNTVVSKGDPVYSKYFNNNGSLSVTLSASDLNLDNNISYTITCTVSMNSGLTADATETFEVGWTDEQCEPNASVSVDETSYTATIQPYCTDADGVLLTDVLISVYRRNFDGTFTEIAKDIPNTNYTFVTDPHPALDYARYRIVARSKTTGAISYCDLTSYPVNGSAVIIQWAEEWSVYDIPVDPETGEPVEDETNIIPWSGSLLKLPYNIDVSENTNPDVEHIEYIGRQHPVSYYGTQLGESASWSVEIAYDDTETLYALRRLQRWMGDVYVREPSGSGYWANISVSFNQKHCETVIPVTLGITRVEGGA